MKWNWQRAGWPAFKYRPAALEPLERQFLLQAGQFVGAFRHIGAGDQDLLRVELLSEEALKTSAIEGEMLDRASVQSSLLHHFGLAPAKPRLPAAERGIAEMMVDLYRTFALPLDDETMLRWHKMLMSGTRWIRTIGGYRRSGDPMQVVSGQVHKRKVHFEAPPAARVATEMRAFVGWFNETSPAGSQPLPAMTRAGIAHLYFVCIHPFEDGNGRIGRAVATKSLAQNLARPSLIALAQAIERKRQDYYLALERNNKEGEITDWLIYFGQTVLDAQVATLRQVDFHFAKTQFYDRLRGQLNERQDKVIARLFGEGLDGFKGGLSAENYIAITRAARATATRDLQDLVAKGALTRTGTLRHTRYRLAL